MQYTFVGTHPESLASGRPVVFGDLVDEKELSEADSRLALTPVAPAKPDSTPNREAK